jgi:hypothetical protein
MLELSEVIKELRRELQTAITDGAGEALRFELGAIDLEVTVAVEKTGGAHGKVRFYVFELGADGSMSNTSTQRIKLTLQPRLADGRTPMVRGQAIPGED